MAAITAAAAAAAALEAAAASSPAASSNAALRNAAHTGTATISTVPSSELQSSSTVEENSNISSRLQNENQLLRIELEELKKRNLRNSETNKDAVQNQMLASMYGNALHDSSSSTSSKSKSEIIHEANVIESQKTKEAKDKATSSSVKVDKETDGKYSKRTLFRKM